MTNAARWAWMLSAVVATGAALVLAFVLSFARPGGFYERHFVWLVWVNAAVALLLVAVLVFVAVRLLLRLKRGKFGSRLLIKLAGIFALVGVLPGIVIYTVSYQFATRSIESWFDERMARALDAGLVLGKGTLDNFAAELLTKTRGAAARLDEQGALLPLALERAREQMGVRQALLLGPSGRILRSASDSASTAPQGAPPTLLRQARLQGAASHIDGLDEETVQAGGAVVRALVRLPDHQIRLLPAEERYLMAVQPLPRALAANALQVQAAYSEYQQRALARDSLRQMYVGTLTLALMLAVFGAVLLAIVLGNQLARPLILLAEGVKRVAAGDYATRPVFPSHDELGGLTRSFADMTAQVSEAREQVQRGMLQLETARTRLQTILDTLSAGVMVFDRDGLLQTVNPGATRILQRPLAGWRGKKLADMPGLEGLAHAIEERFALLANSPEVGERDQWQDSFELARGEGRVGAGVPQALLVRGSRLPEATGGGCVVVFDDITQLIAAQRSAAWGEVARRLAHEIKNPLTPIQLSAERLLAKLEPKLEGADLALLQRSVNTIVVQVGAMQGLVNEFRDYARLPSAQLAPVDLNALAVQVLALYGQAQDNGLLAVKLGEALPAITGDATQLRQVIHNLVQNGLDAVADRPDGLVEITTSAARGSDGTIAEVRLAVIDNGPGFADKVLKRAFEPYVTTKAKGTGLGLAVVKKIADEHGARLRVANLRAGNEPDAPVTGARVSLSFSNLASPRAGARNDNAASKTAGLAQARQR
ncbi:MAG: HAMP domain-containing protein [Burkholderiaceae bacterium]|nr:HAMP domain-containing protein [Burkholderiaceae bacterium]